MRLFGNNKTAAGPESTRCLGNMSTPSRSTVSYLGLGDLVGESKATGQSGTQASTRDRSSYGHVITFRLPNQSSPVSLAGLMESVGVDSSKPDAEKELIDRIEDRAAQMSLPDGAAVVELAISGLPSPWTDTLSILVVLTKASGAVWLRGKTPRLTALQERTQVSLIVPPAFVAGIPGSGR